MVTFTEPRISRRGYRPEGAAGHLSVDEPCLYPDAPFDDTGR